MNEICITGPLVFQTRCGVKGIHSKYQETFRVLGNKWKFSHFERYSEAKDMSYVSNALEVSKALVGLHTR